MSLRRFVLSSAPPSVQGISCSFPHNGFQVVLYSCLPQRPTHPVNKPGVGFAPDVCATTGWWKQHQQKHNSGRPSASAVLAVDWLATKLATPGKAWTDVLIGFHKPTHTHTYVQSYADTHLRTYMLSTPISTVHWGWLLPNAPCIRVHDHNWRDG